MSSSFLVLIRIIFFFDFSPSPGSMFISFETVSLNDFESLLSLLGDPGDFLSGYVVALGSGSFSL